MTYCKLYASRSPLHCCTNRKISISSLHYHYHRLSVPVRNVCVALLTLSATYYLFSFTCCFTFLLFIIWSRSLIHYYHHRYEYNQFRNLWDMGGIAPIAQVTHYLQIYKFCIIKRQATTWIWMRCMRGRT